MTLHLWLCMHAPKRHRLNWSPKCLNLYRNWTHELSSLFFSDTEIRRPKILSWKYYTGNSRLLKYSKSPAIDVIDHSQLWNSFQIRWSFRRISKVYFFIFPWFWKLTSISGESFDHAMVFLTQYHHVTNFAPDPGPVSRKSRNFSGDIILFFQNEGVPCHETLQLLLLLFPF